MDRYNFGPAPGALNVGGMGGPGSGMATVPGQTGQFSGFSDWLELLKAGGLGLGPYGYPLVYGISVPGQQNHLLNQQWGWRGLGNHDFGFGATRPTRRQDNLRNLNRR